MRTWRSWHVLLIFLAAATTTTTQGIYVAYENPREYAAGEYVPMVFNKLTSPRALAAVDLDYLATTATCPSTSVKKKSRWETALDAWHGDFWQTGPPYQIQMLQDVYCQPLCASWPEPWTAAEAQAWQWAIANDYHVNVQLDGLPAAYRRDYGWGIDTRYWGGVPLGRQPENETNTSFVYNHWNIEVWYTTTSPSSGSNNDTSKDKYQVVRTLIEPLSIAHEYDQGANSVVATTDMPSCRASDNQHTSFDMTRQWTEPQAVLTTAEEEGILFTYDVIWKPVVVGGRHKDTDKAAKKRWQIYLTMDDAVPLTFQVAGLVLALILNAIFYGTLIVWMLRDLSYKPIYNQGYDDEEDPLLNFGSTPAPAATTIYQEMKLWPLSTKLFLPPQHVPYLLCSLCGTGAHLLLAGFFYIVFFRMGLINHSLGAQIINPGIIFYTATASVGGYVTGRFCAIFHASQPKALVTTVAMAVSYPLLGVLVMLLAYDVLPDDETAPSYHALSRGVPIFMVWMWLVVPLVLAGGYFGHKHGALHNFPVSESAEGYQDMHLQFEDDERQNGAKQVKDKKTKAFCSRCWKLWLRTPLLFVFAGIPPTLCCFIPFSYGVAGPIFLGYFSSTQVMSILPFALFVTCSAGVSALLYYGQIRVYNYHWWWPAFVSGASCGLHIFLLALSWLFFNVSRNHEMTGRTLASYLIWFAFLGLSVACICGMASVVACIVLNRYLYAHIKKIDTLTSMEEEEMVRSNTSISNLKASKSPSRSLFKTKRQRSRRQQLLGPVLEEGEEEEETEGEEDEEGGARSEYQSSVGSEVQAAAPVATIDPNATLGDLVSELVAAEEKKQNLKAATKSEKAIAAAVAVADWRSRSKSSQAVEKHVEDLEAAQKGQDDEKEWSETRNSGYDFSEIHTNADKSGVPSNAKKSKTPAASSIYSASQFEEEEQEEWASGNSDNSKEHGMVREIVKTQPKGSARPPSSLPDQPKSAEFYSHSHFSPLPSPGSSISSLSQSQPPARQSRAPIPKKTGTAAGADARSIDSSIPSFDDASAASPQPATTKAKSVPAGWHVRTKSSEAVQQHLENLELENKEKEEEWADTRDRGYDMTALQSEDMPQSGGNTKDVTPHDEGGKLLSRPVDPPRDLKESNTTQTQSHLSPATLPPPLPELNHSLRKDGLDNATPPVKADSSDEDDDMPVPPPPPPKHHSLASTSSKHVGMDVPEDELEKDLQNPNSDEPDGPDDELQRDQQFIGSSSSVSTAAFMRP